jgi:PKD repeat protein
MDRFASQKEEEPTLMDFSLMDEGQKDYDDTLMDVLSKLHRRVTGANITIHVNQNTKTQTRNRDVVNVHLDGYVMSRWPIILIAVLIALPLTPGMMEGCVATPWPYEPHRPQGEPLTNLMHISSVSGGAISEEHIAEILGPFKTGVPNPMSLGSGTDMGPLMYSSFFGGGGHDYGYDAMLNENGDLIVVGYTDSNDLPITADAVQYQYQGEVDAFVALLSGSNSSLIYSTYLGGSGYDSATGMALGEDGVVYISGITNSSDFPTTPMCYQPEQASLDERFDAFVCKMDVTTGEVLYSTYLGGMNNEGYPSEGVHGVTINIDDEDRAWIIGTTSSEDFPVTEGCLQYPLSGLYDVFISRLSSDGSFLEYSTCLGGTGEEYASESSLGAGGSIYIVGYTDSTDFPVTPDAYQTTTNMFQDGFVSRISKDGTLEMSTLLGASKTDILFAVCEEGAGDIDLVGITYSDDFPTTTGVIQTDYKGKYDIFVAGLSHDGTSLNWSTFLGGTDYDCPIDMRLDTDNNVILTGFTKSSDFPTTEGAIQSAFMGNYDAICSVVADDGKTLLVSTFLGGSGFDVASSMDLDGNAHILIAGVTGSTDFPTTENAFRTTISNGDAFLTKILLDLEPPKADAGLDIIVDQHEIVNFYGIGSIDNIGISNWTWRFDYNGSEVMLYGETPSFTFDNAGRYLVRLTVRDFMNWSAWDEANVTVRDITPPNALLPKEIYIEQHMTAELDGSKCEDNIGITNWTWRFLYGDHMEELYGAEASFLFDNAGDFEITLTVSDAAGNWANASMVIHVLDIEPPIAEAGPDVSVDQHTEVIFNGTNSTDNLAIINWTWSFVDGATPVTLYGATPRYRFHDAGRFEVRLYVHDEQGNLGTDVMAVQVKDTTPPVAKAGNDIEIKQLEFADFDGSGSRDNIGVKSWCWTLIDSGVQRMLNGQIVRYLFQNAGSYLVTLTVQDAAGNIGQDTITISVRDIESPRAMAGPDIDIRQHELATFDSDASIDNVGITIARWEFMYNGSLVTLEGAVVTFTFNDAGEYIIKLTVLDEAGNSAKDEVEVSVRDTTRPRAIVGPDLVTDQSIEVTFDGQGSTDNIEVTSWAWTFIDEGTQIRLNGKIQKYTFKDAGSYTVELKVEDATGNKDSATMVVRVRDSTSPIALAPDDLTIKKGERTRFDGTASTDNVAVVRWEWSFKDGGKSIKLEGPLASHTFKETGGHQVTLTVWDAEGNRATASFVITVEPGRTMLIITVIVLCVIILIALALLSKRRRSNG